MTVCHRKFEMTMCHKKFEMTACHREFVNDHVPQGICKWPCATKNLKWPCAKGNLKWPCATIIFNQFSRIFMTPGAWNFPNNFFLKNEKKNLSKPFTFWKRKHISKTNHILKMKAHPETHFDNECIFSEKWLIFNLKWPCATIIFNQFSLIFMTPTTWNFPNNFFFWKMKKKTSQNHSHFENENTFWKWKPIPTPILKAKASFWKSD